MFSDRKMGLEEFQNTKWVFMEQWQGDSSRHHRIREDNKDGMAHGWSTGNSVSLQ
jgi:hypothetical protein